MTLFSTIASAFKGRYAILANTISGGILFVTGDFIEQKLEIRAGVIPGIDTARMTRIGIVGLSEGPPHVIFYNYLDKKLPGKNLATVGKKILVDELIACPMFSFQFFMGMGLLEGKSIRDSFAEFARKFKTVFMADILFWPPMQLINFMFVPNRWRVMYVNVVTVAWNVFLSFMKHYDQHKSISSSPPPSQ